LRITQKKLHLVAPGADKYGIVLDRPLSGIGVRLATFASYRTNFERFETSFRSLSLLFAAEAAG